MYTCSIFIRDPRAGGQDPGSLPGRIDAQGLAEWGKATKPRGRDSPIDKRCSDAPPREPLGIANRPSCPTSGTPWSWKRTSGPSCSSPSTGRPSRSIGNEGDLRISPATRWFPLISDVSPRQTRARVRSKSPCRESTHYLFKSRPSPLKNHQRSGSHSTFPSSRFT